jgi:hypothetical protein
MSSPTSASAALPIANVALRILIIVNWIGGAMILALLVAMPNEQWIMQAFKLAPSPDADRLVLGLRVVASLGVAVILLNYGVLKHLLAIVTTVQEGNPFVSTNALRLRTIAWCMLAMQVLSIVIGSIGKMVSSPAHPIRLDAGFSTTGWLAVVLMFVLAWVFQEGSRMRDDLEGTV